MSGMVKGKTIAYIGAGASVLALATGLALASQPTRTGGKKSPPSVSGYSLQLTTSQPSAPVGTRVPYKATLLQNGSPVSGQAVTLTDITTGTTSTTNTNSSGVADFDVTFDSPGTYELQASANV